MEKLNQRLYTVKSHESNSGISNFFVFIRDADHNLKVAEKSATKPVMVPRPAVSMPESEDFPRDLANRVSDETM